MKKGFSKTKLLIIIVSIFFIFLIAWSSGIGIHTCYVFVRDEDSIPSRICSKRFDFNSDIDKINIAKFDPETGTLKAQTMGYFGEYVSTHGLDGNGTFISRSWITFYNDKWVVVSRDCAVEQIYLKRNDSTPLLKEFYNQLNNTYKIKCYEEMPSKNYFSLIVGKDFLLKYNLPIPKPTTESKDGIETLKITPKE